MKQQIEFFYENVVEKEGREILFIDTESTKNVGNFTIKGGNFLQFSQSFFGNRNFSSKSTLTKKCDGVAIEMDSKTLLVIEIKTTIGYRTYKGILQQLCASYLKTLQYLSIIENIENIDIQFFIIGNWENDIEDKIGDYKSGELGEEENIFHSYQKLIRKSYFIFPKMPHFSFLANNIAELYHKTEIKIWFYTPNSTHIFK